MANFRAQSEGVEHAIEAQDMAGACEVASQWLREGDYDLSRGTVWVEATVYELDADGDFVGDREKVMVEIDPDEPACFDDHAHLWRSPQLLVGGIGENPGVFGHGGGVLIKEVCLRCGCGKVTDTWAQNPDTGEQGLESVRYDLDAYDVPAWDMEIDADMIAQAERVPACSKALDWLRASTRTVGELYVHNPYWYLWAMSYVYDSDVSERAAA